MFHPTESDAAVSKCPVQHSADDRIPTVPLDEGPPVERTERGWVVRSAAVARDVLRQGDTARQAGFAAEAGANNPRLRLPLIYNFGEDHRVQRANLARFFAPKTVDTRYRGLMAEQVELAMKQVSSGADVGVDDLAMRFSVGVAREVVGLTNSSVEGLSRRLNRFFGAVPSEDGRLGNLMYRYTSLAKLAAFFVWDVRPATQERRREPREDVISYLIAEGCSDAEILMECIVYAAAGMVTTREFISLALSHLMNRPELRERFVKGEQAERYSILYEILRINPIVVNLHRRMAEDLTVTLDGQEYTFAAGDRVDLRVQMANVDPQVAGECPVQLHPDRPMPRGFKADVIAFGEGPHRCPGSFLAIQESDMLLQEMLKLDLVVEREPDVTVDPVVDSLVLRGMRVRLVA